MTEESTQQTQQASRGGLVGKVVNRSGDKTIKVEVMTLVKHRIYGKYIRRRSNYLVHDPAGEVGVGDQVEILPCRRISKNKSWRLSRLVRPAHVRE
jgi:small subunit ribosomal protein S17